MMQSSNTYNQAIRAARRLRRLQVRYGDQASYLALLVEWMNGLCHAIHLNEDHIQQCWIHRYQSEDEELASELEQEIRRSRDQEEDQNQLLRVQEQLQRNQAHIARIQRETWKMSRRMNRAVRRLYIRSSQLGIQARREVAAIMKEPLNLD